LASPQGSELAKQIERLLKTPRLNDEQVQHLYALVSSLQQEIEQPISIAGIHSFHSDSPVMVMVVSKDVEFNLAIQSAAFDRGWHIQIVSSIASARLQLQNNAVRSILIDSSVAASTNAQPAAYAEEILRLRVEASKHVPVVPVILNSITTAPGTDHIGICVNLPPTDVINIVEAIDAAILTVESNQPHILLVDDDPMILAVLQTMLSPWGLKVTTLLDSQQFWPVLNSAQPDLVVLDVEMPHINGLELCQAVRNDEHWSELPIIFLTAHHESNLIQEVFAIGADDFVTKPVVEPEIILRILNLLERKRLQQLLTKENNMLTASPIALSPNGKTQFVLALEKIQDSLDLLQNSVMAGSETEVNQREEKYQLFQNTRVQFEYLSKLVLSFVEETPENPQ
jgi:DNA-binding response OmpR family regulator